MIRTKTNTLGPPPKCLGEIGKMRWLEISEILSERGDDGPEFKGPLLILCQTYEDHAMLRKQVHEVGTTIQSERGTTRNPDCLNLSTAAGIIAKLSAQLCLTPASQSRMKAKVKLATNDFDEF